MYVTVMATMAGSSVKMRARPSGNTSMIVMVTSMAPMPSSTPKCPALRARSRSPAPTAWLATVPVATPSPSTSMNEMLSMPRKPMA